MDSRQQTTIRGDRRGELRAGSERRSRSRVPGAFNDSCDAAYQIVRKYQLGETKVPLHGECEIA